MSLIDMLVAAGKLCAAPHRSCVWPYRSHTFSIVQHDSSLTRLIVSRSRATTIGILPFATQILLSRLICASSPDYIELTKLRQRYPDVPILALSATCTLGSLRDLIAILRLPPPTDGRGAICSLRLG